MHKDKRIIALIPARGGSKGLPGKNLMPLNGKPLVAWSVAQALGSSLLDRVSVSTDDEEIARVCRGFGAHVPFLRPAHLAADSSPTIDAVLHALDWYEASGERFDYLALLEPTSPLRRKGDIDGALRLLVDSAGSADAVVSVGEVHLENPFVMKVISDGYVRAFVSEQSQVYLQRQALPAVLFPYGVIYASTVPSLRATRSFYPERTIPYPIERWQNFEIDDMCDFICTEAMMNHRLEDFR